jgi:hypothetical protein
MNFSIDPKELAMLDQSGFCLTWEVLFTLPDIVFLYPLQAGNRNEKSPIYCKLYFLATANLGNIIL